MTSTDLELKLVTVWLEELDELWSSTNQTCQVADEGKAFLIGNLIVSVLWVHTLVYYHTETAQRIILQGRNQFLRFIHVVMKISNLLETEC